MSIGEGTPQSMPWEKEGPTITIAGRLPAGLGEDEAVQYWQTIKDLEDLVGSNCEFDRRSFAPHSSTLSKLLDRLGTYFRGPDQLRRDLLVRIAPFLRRACEKILANPNTKLARRYEEVALHKIRSQDTRCLMRLATRPGRTVLEKTARTQKAPAVVRYRSVNTSENRLVRRVAQETLRALMARKEAEEVAGRLEVWSQEENLEALAAICRRILDESPIGELTPMVLVEPNNTLLGDPRYNRVFRTFRAFRHRQEEFDRLWKGGINRFGAAVAWAIRAELAAHEKVLATEAYIKPHVPGSDAAGTAPFFEFSHGDLWFFVIGGPPAVMTVDVDGNEVTIRRRRLEGNGLLRASDEEESWRISVNPDRVAAGMSGSDEDRPQAKQRGYPIEIYCISSPEENLFVMEGRADRQGFGDIARWALECAGLKWRDEMRPEDDQRSVYQRLGVDLFGPKIRYGDLERVENGELLLAVAGGDNGDEIVLSGRGAARALSADPEMWRRYSSEQFSELLGYGDGADDDEACDSQEGLRALRKAVEAGLQGVLGTGTDLAVATPDDLDEVGAQRLRGLLPTTHGERWLVWRSVAAALAWRQEGGDKISEGDVVLVIDADSPRCTATILVGRRESEEESETLAEDDWYWERVAPFVVKGAERATRHAWQRQVAEAMVEGDIEASLKNEVACRLVDEGYVIDSAPGDNVEFPLFVDESPALVRLSAAEEHYRRARESGLSALSDWVEEFSKKGFDELVQKRVDSEGRELRVLLVGEQFQGAETGAAARERIARLFPDAQLCNPPMQGDRVLEGCRIFLERQAQGLPTWRDLIPELKLCVGRGKTKKDIYLLDPEVIQGGVRPGQLLSYEPPVRFSLPTDAEVIDFPMMSGTDEDGRGGEQYTALVRHNALPLDEPVDVKLRVAYRYAEDAFRIFISPWEAPRAAPFEEIQVQWRRGSSEVEQPKRTVRNEPPEFPSASAWDEMESWRLEELKKKVKDCAASVEPFFNKSDTNSRLKNKPEEVKGDLKALSDGLEDIVGWTKKYIVPVGRTLEQPPREVQEVLGEIDKLAAKLIDKWGKKRKKKGKKFPHRQLRRCSDTGVEKAYRDLQEGAVHMLGRLRHLSDRQVLGKLRHDLESEDLKEAQVQPRFETLGRVLGALKEKEEQKTMGWLLEHFSQVLEESLHRQEPDPVLRHILWALATALWSNEEAVHELGQARVERLIEEFLRLARKLSDEWLNAGVSIEIFKELGLVTLALLRLRGASPGQLVGANNGFCDEMAVLMEAIDEGRGFQAKPRIAVSEDEEEVKAFGTLVAENLRGYRVSRIQIVEE